MMICPFWSKHVGYAALCTDAAAALGKRIADIGGGTVLIIGQQHLR